MIDIDTIRDALYTPRSGDQLLSKEHMRIEKMTTFKSGKRVPRCEGKRFDGWHFYQCHSSASVPRGDHWFCRFCDPIAKQEKREARRRAWQEKWDIRDAVRKREVALTDAKNDVVRLAQAAFAQKATFDDLERAVRKLIELEEKP